MNAVAEWIESGDIQTDYQRIETLSHPLAATALSFWENRPRDGIKIGRDIPSRKIARLLSNVLVYEPTSDGRDLKVHLAGTGIRRRFARDVTGQKMSQLFSPSDYPVRYQTMMEAIKQDTPKMARISHRLADTDVLQLEILMMPAVAPNGSDRWALVFCFYF